MRQAILTLQNEAKTQTFKVKTNWKEDSFELTIIEDEAWHANVSESNLAKLASDRGQTQNTYYASLRDHFTDVNPAICFDLNFENDDEGEKAVFTVTRKGGGRALKVFQCTLRKVNFRDCIYNILDDLVNNHMELVKQIEILQKEKSDLETEKNAYEEKLVDFIERKKKWEQGIYNNFLLLLNEKKRRIRFLTNILERKNIDLAAETIPEDDVVPSKREAGGSPDERISDSESSNYSLAMYDESDDSETSASERHEPTPSTSRQDLSVDDVEDKDSSHLALPKRRKRAADEEDEGTETMDEPERTELGSSGKETDADTSEVSSQQLEFSTQDLMERI